MFITILGKPTTPETFDKQVDEALELWSRGGKEVTVPDALVEKARVFGCAAREPCPDFRSLFTLLLDEVLEVAGADAATKKEVLNDLD